MVSNRTLSALTGVGALLAAGSAFAQGAPTIIFAFSGAATDVPLDPWSSMAAALFIVLIAATIFRRRLAGQSQRPGLWLAALAAIAGAAIGGLAFNAIPNANAQPPNLMLTSSPTNIVIGGGNASVIAQNATGGPIRLISVVLANPASGQTIQTPPTTCLAGLTLAPGQTCQIQVQGGKT